MTLTDDQKKHVAAIYTAASENKTVQFRGRDGWFDFNVYVSSFSEAPPMRPDCWRIKPEPKTRPWSKPEDVPGPVCWIRSDIGDKDIELVIGLNRNYVTVGNAIMGGTRQIPWKDFPRDATWEYSTDRKTWHKCEVTEEAQ